jgi:hypothetical protein
MIRQSIQGVKIVMLRLDLRPIGQRKTQPVKNISNPIQGLRDHMHRSGCSSALRKSFAAFPAAGR